MAVLLVRIADMAKRLTIIASFALVLLTIGGLLSVYQLLFAVWMTAYPKADTAAWQVRFYVRLAVTLGIGVCWVALAVWMVRRGRSSRLT